MGGRDAAFDETFTYTFSEAVENHVGMQQLGARREHGHSVADLRRFAELLNQRADNPIPAEVHMIPPPPAGARPEGIEFGEAAVLLIRGGVNQLLDDHGGGDEDAPADALLAEAQAQDYDTRALMRGRVVNKRARHNLCITDAAQPADIEHGRGTVLAFEQLPRLAALRAALGVIKPGLLAEVNRYYDLARCGIGFHGDTERRIVVGVRLGAPLPIVWRWFHRGEPVGGEALRLELRHGDVYVMSEKAAGCDWKRRVIPTLRHATGAVKYLRV